MNKHEERCMRWSTERIEAKVQYLETPLTMSPWPRKHSKIRHIIETRRVYYTELHRRAVPEAAKAVKQKYAARVRPRRYRRWSR